MPHCFLVPTVHTLTIAQEGFENQKQISKIPDPDNDLT